MRIVARVAGKVTHGSVISIIPKGNKPRELLKNWRPISLLNTTYKIFSGIIANRLKTVLNTLIHENQKGFKPVALLGKTLGFCMT